MHEQNSEMRKKLHQRMMPITEVSITVQHVNMCGSSLYYNRRKSLAFGGGQMTYMWQGYIRPQNFPQVDQQAPKSPQIVTNGTCECWDGVVVQ